jgi:hypothetical protein
MKNHIYSLFTFLVSDMAFNFYIVVSVVAASFFIGEAYGIKMLANVISSSGLCK